MRIDLRSRRGVSNPAAFILVFPVWYIVIGILLVLGFWMWSLAINFIGISQGGQALAVGRDPEMARRGVIAAGLGGFGTDYADASYSRAGREATASIDKTIPVQAFPAPRAITIQAGTIIRIEKFYSRPPEAGGWE
ncbi:MAG: hypothetical protein M1546_21865 [Chloroflexi bacterium]|nr:hypothetical protein [Chloroflexota bacterium]